MNTAKYSRQREAVKEYLMSTVSHPTADEVYKELKELYPNISLGTVYRNLNLLVEQGEAQKITTEAGGDHFDGNPDVHYHFLCDCCGHVSDLQMELMPQLNILAQVGFDGKVTKHSLMFGGLCAECSKAKQCEAGL